MKKNIYITLYEICFEMNRPEDDSGTPSEFWYIARVYLK